MSGKVSRFLMTLIASMVLVACGVETMEVMPDQAEEEIELIESEETAITESEEVTETKEAVTETQSDSADESTVVKATEKETEVAPNELQVKNRERALNQLLIETHLEKDAYSFYCAETDSLDFVQIEVREIQEEAAHATLEGVYRYILETEEVLMRDYLTGDFMPYEKIE